MPDLTFRPAQPADASQVLALIHAVDIAEIGFPDFALEDLEFEWSEVDLARDAFLAFTGDALVGYALVSRSDYGLQYHALAQPDAEPGQVYSALLSRCDTRAGEILAAGKPAGADTIIYFSDNSPGVAVFRQAGFSPRKYIHRMKIAMAEEPADPRFPVQLSLTTIKPEADAHQVYQFIQTAFERPGRIAPSFQDWRDLMMRPDHFHPELWFLLRQGDEIVAAALCFDYGDYGWVRQLGVAEKWRCQGLAASLLRLVFRQFYQMGRREVALTVDSTNPVAGSVYQRSGMTRQHTYIELVRPLTRA